mmetsp:Transcript_18635/g.26868  ORF Transcript_18635/g.26868 Transcript_18635/m.26868 type:complete len:796 (+) Transcript_18635:244-2631(+)
MKLSVAACALLVGLNGGVGAFTHSRHSSWVHRSVEAPWGTALRSTAERKDVSVGVETVNGAELNMAESSAQGRLVGSAGITATKESMLSYLSQFEGESGAAVIYSKLQEHGVTVVNGFSGGAVLPLLDQFHVDHPRHKRPGAPTPIQWITNSNESSAGHIAEGIAKSSTEADGRLAAGIAVATSGPGVTNLVTPVTDAMCDGVPLVVLCGQAATSAPIAAFQSCPASEIMRPVTKWSYRIQSAAELPFVMDYAFYVARSGRPGPVYIDLPKDLQNHVISAQDLDQFIGSVPTVSTAGADLPDAHLTRFMEHTPGTGDYGLHLGDQTNGLFFDVGPGRLVEVKPSVSSPYQLDHHTTSMVYRGTSLDKVDPASPDKGTLDPNSQIMTELATLIAGAKKPFIIAGQGCNDAPDELKAFAEKLKIPVATTLHGLGCFDERHPLALNMLGMHGHPTPNYMIQESDLVICIGSRFDDRITGRVTDFIPEARKAASEGRGGVIHVDVRFSENALQVEPTFFVHSTGKDFLRSINEKLNHMGEDVDPNKTNAWLKQMKSMQQQFPVKIPRFPSYTDQATGAVKTPSSAQSVIAEINRQLLAAGQMDEAIFTTGVGIHQMVAAQLITWTQPRQMLSSGSLGTMGVALGYCIGAKLANMGKIVIAIDGDGSFNMTFTELKTVAELKLPIKIIILDNEGQMMVEYWQKLFHDERLIAVRNSKNPEYTILADSFGIKNIYCDCEEDLPEKMNEFLFADPDEPVLFHMRINRTPCLPLVAPGAALDSMILSDADQEEMEFDAGAAPS